jgi:hypothetical protein
MIPSFYTAYAKPYNKFFQNAMLLIEATAAYRSTCRACTAAPKKVVALLLKSSVESVV